METWTFLYLIQEIFLTLKTKMQKQVIDGRMPAFVQDGRRGVRLEDHKVDMAYKRLVELKLIPSTTRASGIADKIATIVDQLSRDVKEESVKFIESKGYHNPHLMISKTGRADVGFWEFLWDTYGDLGGNVNSQGRTVRTPYAGFPPNFWRQAPKSEKKPDTEIYWKTYDTEIYDTTSKAAAAKEAGPCEEISKFRRKREMQQECMRLKNRDPSLNCSYKNLSNSLCAFYSTNYAVSP